MFGDTSQNKKNVVSFSLVQAYYTPNNLILKGGGLTIAPHRVVGLIGKNGAGKTTLINSLCGIHRKATFEEFLFEDQPSSVDNLAFKASRYACFAQDSSFRYWNMAKLIKFIESAFSLTPNTCYLQELIDGFELQKLQNIPLGKLSDGQRKKVALCGALYARRSLLLLDEPVDFLDFSSTEYLYDALSAYAKRFGSIVLSSHIAESITRCASELYTLEDGTVSGPFTVPESSEDVARLLAS